MAVPTSRTKEKAEIRINEELCTGCGFCVRVCKDFSLEIVDGKARVSDKAIFGCLGCGHCMAICPTGSIEIHGREISPDDLFELPPPESAADYDQLSSLMKRRRSIREFKDAPVPWEITDKILKAARTAPMGLPPSDVNVLVFDSKDKVKTFTIDFCNYLKGMRWMVSKWFITMMRPFWGVVNDELFRRFLRPLFHIYARNPKEGVNMVTYDAPLAIYFYGSPYSDPADPIIAATYAMLAAESMGLGTCMIGGIHPFIQKGSRARLFRDIHGIKYASKDGIFVIFGFPDVEYSKGINRSFASVLIERHR